MSLEKYQEDTDYQMIVVILRTIFKEYGYTKEEVKTAVDLAYVMYKEKDLLK